jgi:DNA-binding FadR family transcriptional regulator
VITVFFVGIAKIGSRNNLFHFMIVEKKAGGDAVERASVFLRNEFRIQGLSIGDRVPSPKVLARKAGVSTQAMCRAMARLKDQGIITITRSGTFRGPPAEALPRHQATGRKWERVKERIRGDIYSGVHPEGQNLPETAELMKQYGVSRPTLRKTLEALVEEGALVSSRRDFRVPNVRAETSHACVLSISLEGMDDRPDLISEWAQQFTSNLLSQCRNHRVHMRAVGYKPQRPHQVFQDELRAAHERENPIGYVIWSRAIPRDRLMKILQDLQPKKRPMAVLDDEGTLEIPSQISDNLRYKLFSIGTEHAGSRTGSVMTKSFKRLRSVLLKAGPLIRLRPAFP